jgi:hypothetical protein
MAGGDPAISRFSLQEEIILVTNLSTGYTPIPDGLWYCDLSHGAVRILGWLHVQQAIDIHPTDIQAAFGPESGKYIVELVMAGFLTSNRTSGERLAYQLVPGAWEKLA